MSAHLPTDAGCETCERIVLLRGLYFITITWQQTFRKSPDMGRLQHKCNRLRLLATCSITITNKQNHNVIDYDYIVLDYDHDYNLDYICLEISSERKQTPFAWFDVSIFSDNIRYESMQ